MKFSCILLSHNKPDLVKEAVQSVLDQTYEKWECVLIDSGVLFDAGHFNYIQDRRFRIYRSDETEAIRQTKAIAPWNFNWAFKQSWVTGDLIVYLADDDLLKPVCMEKFKNFFAAECNGDILAAYGDQEFGYIDDDGKTCIVGTRKAEPRLRGFDCVVDGGQLCHRYEVWGKAGGWPEDLQFKTHSDGIFLETIATKVGKILPIPDTVVSVNRKCATSTFQTAEDMKRRHR